jgi:hypothetical protein
MIRDLRRIVELVLYVVAHAYDEMFEHPPKPRIFGLGCHTFSSGKGMWFQVFNGALPAPLTSPLSTFAVVSEAECTALAGEAPKQSKTLPALGDHVTAMYGLERAIVLRG